MDRTIGLQDIYFDMAKVIKATFPEVKKIYQNKVKNLTAPSFFMELVSYASPAIGPRHIEKRVKLDLVYFTETREVSEAIGAMDRLSKAFAWGLRVYKRDKDGQVVYDGKRPIYRYLHVDGQPSYEVVEGDLHFLIGFVYVDETLPTYVTLDPMEGYDYGYPSDYDSDREGLGGKEVTFKDDEKDEKRKAYIDQDVQYMEELLADIDVKEEKRKDK